MAAMVSAELSMILRTQSGSPGLRRIINYSAATAAAGKPVRQYDGSSSRRADGARGARYPAVAAENPSILGLLAYVQCAELPCRAASAPQPAKVAKLATSQWAATKQRAEHAIATSYLDQPC